MSPGLIRRRYDRGLLEEAVRLELRRRETEGDERLFREYHRRAEPLYHLSPERRENEFVALHLALFRELGFDGRIVAALDGHRTVPTQVDSVTFPRPIRDREDRYAALAVDDTPFVRGVASSDPRTAIAPADQHDPLFLTARGAGNPIALPRRSAVENLNAAGVGTITSGPPEAQVIRGEGRWADGKWRVVMVRSLRTPNARDAQFQPGESTAVAFAVWDGAQRDRDGQKAVSVWQRLLIE